MVGELFWRMSIQQVGHTVMIIQSSRAMTGANCAYVTGGVWGVGVICFSMPPLPHIPTLSDDVCLYVSLSLHFIVKIN